MGLDRLIATAFRMPLLQFPNPKPYSHSNPVRAIAPPLRNEAAARH